MVALAFWLLFMTSHSETKQIFADVSIWHLECLQKFCVEKMGENVQVCKLEMTWAFPAFFFCLRDGQGAEIYGPS